MTEVENPPAAPAEIGLVVPDQDDHDHLHLKVSDSRRSSTYSNSGAQDSRRLSVSDSRRPSHSLSVADSRRTSVADAGDRRPSVQDREKGEVTERAKSHMSNRSVRSNRSVKSNREDIPAINTEHTEGELEAFKKL